MFRLKSAITALGLGLLTACTAPVNPGQVTRVSPANISLPAMKTPAGAPAAAPTRSNLSISREFILLAFQLESGRTLPVLSRFEGPITLRTSGMPIGPVSQRDLDQLLDRLRTEARVPITQVNSDEAANITIEFIPLKTLRRTVPNAACFVAPGVTSWKEFNSRRSTSPREWTDLTTRTHMAVFIPGNVSAQEIRDCLHEEIAQALGPVNDLYHLTDSIFNDDNFHTILTGFDMVILRAFYDDSLQSGMTREAVAARLPAILARINPGGRSGGTSGSSPTSQSWTSDIETALGARGVGSKQLAAAKRAVRTARGQGWNDNRLGFSLYAQGRLALAHDTTLALASFAEAEKIFRADPNTRLHAAHVAVQAAAYALSSGRPNGAIEIVDENSAVALKAENPNLLSTLLMIKAAALDALGKSPEATIVRLDSLGWARYGLGSETEIRDRLAEITALAPRPKRNPVQ